MSYQVIARRWRPQNFSEVVYQDHISKTIQNSIVKNRISHAYIFSGPRGVGKTTTARILAKSLNCMTGPTPEPCGVCENCVEIKDGNSFDVIEIDGASNNGVDHIRSLRENVNFAPVKSKYKVYIIDEVHMLSTSAFNALLKTLEEPPPHVVFIFATTEIHKVPDTILSRCQKYFFKKITTDVIVAHLSAILSKENISFNNDALYPIARAAGGSMRDAQSLLEQVISYTDGEITFETTLSILGVVPLTSFVAMLKFIGENNLQGLMAETERIISLGTDLQRYNIGLMEIIRAIRLIKNQITNKDILGFSDDEFNQLKGLVSVFSDEELSGIFKIAEILSKEIKYSDNDRILLEMSLLDMASLKKAPSLTQIIKRIDEISAEKKKLIEDHESVNKIQKTAAVNSNNENTDITKTLSGDSVPDSHIENPSKRNSEKTIPVKEEKLNLKEAWVELLSNIKVTKLYLFNKINKSKIEFKNDLVIIDQNSANSLHNIILDSKDISYLKDELSSMCGFIVAIDIVKEQISEPLPDAQMVSDDSFSELMENDPYVSKVVDMFFGEIIK